MNKTHLQPFLDAMHARNPATLAAHMADEVTLRSPILPDPIAGKEPVGKLLAALLEVVDEFTVTDMIEAETHAAVFITIRAGEAEVTGVDDMHVDHNGLVSAMTIQWRPLGQIVAMQQLLAPVIGAPVMTLIAA